MQGMPKDEDVQARDGEDREAAMSALGRALDADIEDVSDAYGERVDATCRAADHVLADVACNPWAQEYTVLHAAQEYANAKQRPRSCEAKTIYGFQTMTRCPMYPDGDECVCETQRIAADHLVAKTQEVRRSRKAKRR